MKTDMTPETSQALIKATQDITKAVVEKTEAYLWIAEIGAEMGIHPGDKVPGSSDHAEWGRFAGEIIRFIRAQEESASDQSQTTEPPPPASPTPDNPNR